MTEHSKIGPSALHRLLACPGSHKLSETKPQGGSSVYAAQGTVAHALIERELRGDSLVEYAPGDVVVEEGHEIVIDEEMLEGVREMVTFCKNLMKPTSTVWIEQRVDLKALWAGDPPEPIFGTVDFASYHPETSTLYVVDFKYGRLPVFPENNPQASAYALGACYQLGFFPDSVVKVIIQPRGQDGQTVKVAAISGLDLQIWADDVLKPGVDACFDQAPPLATGDHCRFCPAKIDCPALYALAKEAAKTDFSHLPPDPIHLDDDELAHILNNAEVIAMWIDAVRAEASGRVERGKRVPGWKLVPKKAIRKWADQQKAESILLTDGAYYDLKIKSPTQIEKIDPALYEDLFEKGLVVKNSSGTTLVPDRDPRDAVVGKSAKEEFGLLE